MNIYIQNHAEINAISMGENAEHRRYDANVALDIYDKRHGLPYSEKARAEYKQYIGLPLSVTERRLVED